MWEIIIFNEIQGPEEEGERNQASESGKTSFHLMFLRILSY